jgi:hypothetical protein
VNDEHKAAIRAEAIKVGTELGLLDADIVNLIDFSDVTIGPDGVPRGVADAMHDHKRRKPRYYGLPDYTAREMSDGERYQTLLKIKQREVERQARRNAAPALKPGETRKSAKDMSPAEYAATLAQIRRRHA